MRIARQNPGGAGGESGADAFPGHPRDGVYAGVHRGADGDGRGVPALLALDPVAGGGEGQGDPPVQAEKPLELTLPDDQQRRAKPDLGRGAHHRPGRRPAGDQGGCGAAANRGGGQSGAEEGGLVFHDQRRRRDAARTAAAVRAALRGVSTDGLSGRTAPGGLGRDDLLREGEHGEGELVCLGRLFPGGAAVPRGHPEDARRRGRQGVSVPERVVRC